MKMCVFRCWLSLHLNDDSRKSSHITITTETFIIPESRASDVVAVKSSQASSNSGKYISLPYACGCGEVKSGENFMLKS